VNGDQLSAALRAQASALGTGPPKEPHPRPASAAGPSRSVARLPAWTVLVLAVVLGAVAGGLAGAISTW
jgi:type VI protein secretion system component VasF